MVELIQTIEDVRAFAECLRQEGTIFHPDDDFSLYVVEGTGDPAFTAEEAKLRNDLMKKCFEICEKEGLEIYLVMSGEKQSADAQQKAIDHPKTFEAPSISELDQIKAGVIVKICAENPFCTGERFWVEIKKIEGEIIIGTIENHLILTEQHGLAFGDAVFFERKHIFNIDKEE